MTSKGVKQEDYSFIKTFVAEYFDRHKLLSMLLVLYRELFVGDGKLTYVERTIDLLNALEESDKISYEDVSLLYDTIKITDHFLLQRKLKEEIQYFPDVRKIKISTISSYRQKLVRFGNGLTKKDLSVIDALYNLPLKEYSNSWDMIRDLEYKQIIKPEMTKFVKSLQRFDLKRAVSILSEDVFESDSTTATTGTPTPSSCSPTATNENTTSMYELSETEYNQLLVNVSEHWENYGDINMLKVLLLDFKAIGTADIQKTDDIFELFRLLRSAGKISPSNIDVIAEAAALCGIDSMKEVISKTLPAYTESSEIHQLTKFCRNVVEFGKRVTVENLKKIMKLYAVPYKKNQDDIWYSIFELEINDKLTLINKESFIKNLRENEMTREADALNTY